MSACPASSTSWPAARTRPARTSTPTITSSSTSPTRDPSDPHNKHILSTLPLPPTYMISQMSNHRKYSVARARWQCSYSFLRVRTSRWKLVSSLPLTTSPYLLMMRLMKSRSLGSFLGFSRSLRQLTQSFCGQYSMQVCTPLMRLTTEKYSSVTSLWQQDCSVKQVCAFTLTSRWIPKDSSLSHVYWSSRQSFSRQGRSSSAEKASSEKFCTRIEPESTLMSPQASPWLWMLEQWKGGQTSRTAILPGPSPSWGSSSRRMQPARLAQISSSIWSLLRKTRLPRWSSVNGLNSLYSRAHFILQRWFMMPSGVPSYAQPQPVTRLWCSANCSSRQLRQSLFSLWSMPPSKKSGKLRMSRFLRYSQRLRSGAGIDSRLASEGFSRDTFSSMTGSKMRPRLSTCRVTKSLTLVPSSLASTLPSSTRKFTQKYWISVKGSMSLSGMRLAGPLQLGISNLSASELQPWWRPCCPWKATFASGFWFLQLTTSPEQISRERFRRLSSIQIFFCSIMGASSGLGKKISLVSQVSEMRRSTTRSPSSCGRRYSISILRLLRTILSTSSSLLLRVQKRISTSLSGELSFLLGLQKSFLQSCLMRMIPEALLSNLQILERSILRCSSSPLLRMLGSLGLAMPTKFPSTYPPYMDRKCLPDIICLLQDIIAASSSDNQSIMSLIRENTTSHLYCTFLPLRLNPDCSKKLPYSFYKRSIDRSFRSTDRQRGVPCCCGLLLVSNCLKRVWLKSSGWSLRRGLAGCAGLSRELQPLRWTLGLTEPVRWCERMNWLLQVLSSPSIRFSSLTRRECLGRCGRASQFSSPFPFKIISCFVRRCVISSSSSRFCVRSSFITLSLASRDSRSVSTSFASTMQLQRSRFSWNSSSGALADSQETLWTVYLLLGSPNVSLFRFKRSIFLKSSRIRSSDCSETLRAPALLSFGRSRSPRSLSFSPALSAVFLSRELSSSSWVLVLQCLLWLRSLIQSSRNSMNWWPSSRYFCRLVETDSRKQPSMDTTRFLGSSQGREWYILPSGMRVRAWAFSAFCEVDSPLLSSCPSLCPFCMSSAQSCSTSSVRRILRGLSSELLRSVSSRQGSRSETSSSPLLYLWQILSRCVICSVSPSRSSWLLNLDLSCSERFFFSFSSFLMQLRLSWFICEKRSSEAGSSRCRSSYVDAASTRFFDLLPISEWPGRYQRR